MKDRYTRNSPSLTGVDPKEGKEERVETLVDKSWDNEKVWIDQAMVKAHTHLKHHNKLCGELCKLLHKLDEKEMGDIKKSFLLGLYEIVNGCHFDEETARMAVSCMENADGSNGEYFTMEESDKAMHTYSKDTSGNKYNHYDWYVVMNMMWSDYCGVLGNKVEMYIAMTDAYFNGPDEKEGKAWEQLGKKLLECGEGEEEDN